MLRQLPSYGQSQPSKPASRPIFKSICLTVSSALVLASCASAGGGQTMSAFTQGTLAQAEQLDTSSIKAGDALVVIRYPAFIDDNAKAIFFDLYGDRTIGDKAPGPEKYLDNAEQLANAFLLKNHYFATSIYKALKKQLPPDTVFLSPHTIKRAKTGEIITQPVLSAESLPHALTVDFTTYSFPDSDRMLEANAMTFGDLVTPLSVIRTDHRALPQTHGLLAASAPFITTAWKDAQADSNPVNLDQLDEKPDNHILIDFLDRAQVGAFPTRLRLTEAPGRKVNVSKVDILPVERLQMNSAVVKRLPRSGRGLGDDPFGSIYAQGYAARIIRYLNAIDIPKATAAAKQRAVANFDYDAAHLYFAAGGNRSVKNRVDFAERLLKAERRYLAGQSEALEASLAPDKFGKQLAELFAAEQDNLEQRRELARQQNTRMMMAVLGAMAAGAAAYGASKEGKKGNTGAQTGYQVLATAGVALAGYGVISSRSKKAQSKMVGSNFLASIAPSLETTQGVTVDLVEGTEEITAANYPELREKMLGLYRTRLRSMDESAVPCTFSSPDSVELGTWYGPCEDGRATGDGYGTISAGPAGNIEYFGEASGGFAAGTGYMVIRNTDGTSISYEGGFLGGRPHGPVEMTQTGEGSKTGVYENGERIGRLPRGVTVPELLASRQAVPVLTDYGR
ncbi:MAG: hypothetical protein AAGA36_08025 [Pseudomonadota bacterium]